MEHLFVYGSLRRGQRTPEAKLLEAAGEWIGPATTRGQIRTVSWYPGLVDGDGDAQGEVWRLGDAGVLARLDEYEGEEFRRVARRVRLADGRELDAWLYLYAPDAETMDRRSDLD